VRAKAVERLLMRARPKQPERIRELRAADAIEHSEHWPGHAL
jgi:hypothetical protein